MRVTVHVNADIVGKLSAAVARAAYRTMDLLKTQVTTASVMPFDTGTMQNTLTYVEPYPADGDAALVTDGPYANRLYHHPEYNFQKGNNANAQGEWLRPWIDGDQREFIEKTYARTYSEEVGR